MSEMKPQDVEALLDVFRPYSLAKDVGVELDPLTPKLFQLKLPVKEKCKLFTDNMNEKVFLPVISDTSRVVSHVKPMLHHLAAYM